MRKISDCSRKLGFISLGFVVACSDAGTTSGNATATGGAQTTGGSASGGQGGSVVGSGGLVSTGTGGAPGAGQAGVGTTGGTTGGQSAGGMAGQSTGGQSGGMGPSNGGQAGGGGGAQGGAQAGGGKSGGAAGSNMVGGGGASGGAQGGAQAGGGKSGGAAGASGGAGKGGASSGGQGGASSTGGKGTAGAGTGGSGPSGCKGGKVVHFVYFVESDQTLNESHRNDIEKQAFAFQNYWFQQLGVTFYLNEPVVDVIKADHPASWYLTNPDGIHGSDDRWYRLGNIKNEVYRKLGISNFDPNHRVVNYPTTRHDGRVGGNFGGAWMDGDDMTCIATNGLNYPYDDRNSAHCMGHVAHEFGHVLGLGHEGPTNDCMQYGFYVSAGGAMCTFSAANTAKIRADPDNAGWLNAMPGQTCTGG